jgi:hypothetical protein
MQRETSAKNKETRSKTPHVNRILNNGKYGKKHIKRNIKKKSKSNTTISISRIDNLKPINFIEIDYILKRGLFEEGGSPETIIKDIFPVIKEDIDVFFKEDIFNKDTQPADFLYWMLQCYDDVQDEPWDIAYYDRDEKFHIETYYEYNDIGCEGKSVGLRFMPELKKKNEDLFWLLVALLSCLKNTGVPFWFNNMMHEQAIDSVAWNLEDCIEDFDKDEETDARNALAEYKCGEPYVLKSQIEDCNISLSELILELKDFKPKNKLERKCKNILDLGIELALTGKSFPNFIHVTKEEYDYGWPGTANEYACLGWSYEKTCPIAYEESNFYESSTNEYGVAPFRELFLDSEKITKSKFPEIYVKMLNKIREVEEEIMKST